MNEWFYGIKTSMWDGSDFNMQIAYCPMVPHSF